MRRKCMNTFNNKLFNILSELVDVIIEYNILEKDPEKRKPNTWFSNYLHNLITDKYWRDPHYEKLGEVLSKINSERISECVRLYLREHDYIGGLKFFSKLCGCTEDTLNEFGILYQSSIITFDEETEDIERLQLRIKELEEEVDRLTNLLKLADSKKGFTRDNITEDSVKFAKVRISLKKSGYENTYDCIEDLLEAENLELEPTVKNGFKGLANILKERSINGNPSDTFVCISLKGYRIDFIYEI